MQDLNIRRDQIEKKNELISGYSKNNIISCSISKDIIFCKFYSVAIALYNLQYVLCMFCVLSLAL